MSENFELAVMLKEGARRQQVLRAVSESEIPLGSREVSKRTGIAQSNTIRILRELEAKGALREVTGRRRNRRYEITEKGKRSLSTKERLSSNIVTPHSQAEV